MNLGVGLRCWRTVGIAVAFAAIVGACGPAAPKLPSDSSPGAVHQLINGPDSDQFLHEISDYRWGSDSRRVTDLFAWIPRDATTADTQQRTSAGETAHAVATFLADNADKLMGGKGGDDKDAQNSIGAVNPELTRTCADVIIPYLGALVGDEAGTSGFQPLDGLSGPMPRAAALFGVVGTDATAGNRLADAIGTVAGNYEQGFANSAATDPTSVTRSDVDLVRAARLLGLASSSRLHRSDGSTFQPGDVVADLQYRLAARLATGPNADLPQQYFKPDGSLESPREVRAKSGEFGWEDYTSKLGAYMAKFPPLTTAISEFQREFSVAAESAPNQPR